MPDADALLTGTGKFGGVSRKRPSIGVNGMGLKSLPVFVIFCGMP